MKKAISLVLVTVMILALGGCASEGQALYEKYAPIIDMLEAKDYQGAIRDITAMAIEEQKGDVEEVPVMQILCNTWYTTYEDAPEEITFREDGTCTIGGKSMTWLAEESRSDTYLRLQISENGKICRYVSLETGNVVPYLHLSYAEERDDGIYSGEGIGTYYDHPLMPYLLRSWYDLSDYETVNGVESFYLGTSSASVNNDNCDWSLTDRENKDSLVAHIDAKNDREGAYTVTLTMRDGHPVVTFTDDTNGETGLYYTGNHDGYEKSWPEYVYAEAMENLNDYLEDGNFYCDITETSYSDGDDNAVSYLYDQFVSLGDHADAAQTVENWDAVLYNQAARYLHRYLENGDIYVNKKWIDDSEALGYIYGLLTKIADYSEASAMLDRFTVVEDVFLKSTYESTDNMGNVSSNNTDEVQEYNEQGQVAYYSGYTKLNRLYGNSYGAYYAYDESGRVSGINLGYTDRTYVQITPTYDANGNKISEHVVKNDGEFDITYTYDDQNRLIGVRRPNTSYTDPDNYYYTWTYTYDDAGNLLQEVYAYMDNGNLRNEYINSYTYDAAGVLTQETETYNFYSYSHNTLYETHTYTADCVCDDQGRVIQKNWTYGNTVYSDGREEKAAKASSVYTYTYGDVYFFDATGMDTAE